MRGKIVERGKKRGVFIRRIIAFNLTCEFVCICFCVRSDEECSNDKIEKLAVLRESSRCGIYFRSMYIQRNAGYGGEDEIHKEISTLFGVYRYILRVNVFWQRGKIIVWIIRVHIAGKLHVVIDGASL